MTFNRLFVRWFIFIFQIEIQFLSFLQKCPASVCWKNTSNYCDLLMCVCVCFTQIEFDFELKTWLLWSKCATLSSVEYTLFFFSFLFFLSHISSTPSWSWIYFYAQRCLRCSQQDFPFLFPLPRVNQPQLNVFTL